MVPSQIRFCCAMMGTPGLPLFKDKDITGTNLEFQKAGGRDRGGRKRLGPKTLIRKKKR